MGRWKLGGPRGPSYYVLGGPLSPEALLSQFWALCILRNTGVVTGKIQRGKEDSPALRCMCQNVMATREYQLCGLRYATRVLLLPHIYVPGC